MTLLTLTGFETGAVNSNVANQTAVSVQSTVKRSGTYALQANPTGTAVSFATVGYCDPAADNPGQAWNTATVYFSFYFRADTLPATGNEEFFKSITVGGVQILSLRVSSAGLVAVYNAADGLVATGTTALATGTWYDIQLMVATGGSPTYDLKINGVSELSGSGAFGATSNGLVRLGKHVNKSGNTVNFYYDDFIASTSDVYLNQTIAAAMVPTGVGNYTGFGGGTGASNWTQMHDVPSLNTTYSQSAAVNTAITSNITDTSAAGIAGTIIALSHLAFVARLATGAQGFNRIRYGGADYNGPVHSPGGSSTTPENHIWELSPATGLAWTTTEIDGLEVGYVEDSSSTQRIRYYDSHVEVAYLPAVGGAFTASLSEAASFVESRSQTTAAAASLAEALAAADAPAATLGLLASLSEALALADARSAALAGAAALAEAASFADAISTGVNYALSLSETLSLADVPAATMAAAAALAEAASLAEVPAETMAAAAARAELLALSDTVALIGYGLALSEALALADASSAAAAAAASLGEALALADLPAAAMAATAARAEALALVDTLSTGVSYALALNEALSLIDAPAAGAMQAAAALTEALALADAISTGVNYALALAEALSLADVPAATMQATAALAEALALAEAAALAGAAYAASLSEALSLADALSTGVNYPLALAEALALADTPIGVVQAAAALAEALPLADTRSGAMHAAGALAEALALADRVFIPSDLTEAIDEALAFADTLSGTVIPADRAGIVDSSTGGCLLPGAGDPFSLDTDGLGFEAGAWDGGEPAEDDALDDLLHQLVCCVTGLAPELVRPRWQPEPANQPPAETTWCSLGVINIAAETYAWIGHDPTGDGSDELRRQEEIEVLLTFYGPRNNTVAALLRDGLQIRQNRALLVANDMNLVECGDLGSTAELIKQRWIGRTDMRMTIVRQVRRIYPVLNLLAAQGVVTGAGAPDPAGKLPTARFDTGTVD